VQAILAEVKRLESEGCEFEAAEASFEMLIRKQIGLTQPSSISSNTTARIVSTVASTVLRPARPPSRSKSMASEFTPSMKAMDP
jgi:hypothetical protein